MFKRFKLGTKIFTGFGCALAVIAVGAVVGYLQLSTVVKRMDISENMNRIVEKMATVRQDEKAFMLGSGTASVASVHRHIKAIGVHLNDARSLIVESAGSERLDRIDQAVSSYLASFDAYVAMESQKVQFGQEMTDAADAAYINTENIRDIQHRQLNTVKEQSALSVSHGIDMAAKADRIIELMLECRQSEKDYLLTEMPSYTDRVKFFIDNIVREAEALKGMMADPKDRGLTDYHHCRGRELSGIVRGLPGKPVQAGADTNAQSCPSAPRLCRCHPSHPEP